MKKFFKASSIFFILAFTFSIFCFISAFTIIEAKTLYNKRYNSDNNKILSFNLSQSLPLNDFLTVIEKYDLTITLSKFIFEDIDKENTGYELITKLKTNEYDSHNNMLTGNYFSNTQFANDEKIALTTINKKDVTLHFLSNNIKKEIPLNIIGTISGEARSIILPNKIFFDYLQTDDLSLNAFSISLSGSKDNIANAIASIDKFSKTLVSLDNEPAISIYSPIMSNSTLEARFLILMTVLVVFITILNSIFLSSLWVENRKKELILRKVCGARNKDIFNLFLKELSLLTLISFILATILYFLLMFLTNGILFGMKLKLGLTSIIGTILVSIFTMYIVSIPSMKYISKLQIIDILRED